MLPIQTIRERTAEVRRALVDRHTEAPIDDILGLDERRRELLAQVETMRADRNRASKAIGGASDPAERERLIAEQREVKGRLDTLEDELRAVEPELHDALLQVPNLFHGDVPLGEEADGVIVIEGDGRSGEEQRPDPPRRVGDEPQPGPEPGRRPHWEIGEDLGLIDFERGVKLAGSRFYILRDGAARLQRALIAWMLELHRERGWSEVYVPFVVKEEMLVGTAQLPKNADTMYHDAEDDLWLVPTGEVPVTNMYRDEILAVDDLPIWHAAYTPCFRREKMSAGRDVRGIKRGHQFDKVELVKFVEPGRSWEELDGLLEQALEVVRRLGLRYRVVRLASADISFAAAMTYDIEVWSPGCGEWLEVSSISNFLDFQAHRANLRYRDADGRVQHLHTLNGSALALPRTLAAILEQYERPDRSIELPEVLRPYLGGVEAIAARV